MGNVLANSMIDGPECLISGAGGSLLEIGTFLPWKIPSRNNPLQSYENHRSFVGTLATLDKA